MHVSFFFLLFFHSKPKTKQTYAQDADNERQDSPVDGDEVIELIL